MPTAPALTRALDGLKNWKLFVLTVVVPTLLGTAYFGYFAPDIYVSESHFVVRNQAHQSLSGLGSLLQNTGLSSAGESEVYSVQDYLTSRDALERLDAQFKLSHLAAASPLTAVAQWLHLPADHSFESLLRYYRKHIVETEFDSSSSILTLTVRAPDSQTAFAVNESLLKMSEEFVNKMNERSRTDLLKYSSLDVANAEHQALAAVHAVSVYRNGESVFDPEKQSALQLEQVSRLQQELISTERQLADVQAVAVSSPQLPVLKNRIRGLQGAIAAEMAKVAGGDRSLSSKSEDYESVAITRDFAAKRLELAQASLQAARENAIKQQIYIERIAQPNRPDEAIEPKRIRNIFGTFAISLIVFGILSLIGGAVRDHVE